MNIILISPIWSDVLGMFAKLARKRYSQPPLGILYLATVAEKKGHTVSVIDGDVEDCNSEELVDRIVKGNYDIIGITTTSPIFHKAAALAEALKSRKVRAPILIGGEHINILKEDAFLDCVDFAFYGESDLSFDEFLKVYENTNRDFSGVRGLIYRKNGSIIINEPAGIIEDIDSLPFPAMHLVRRKAYVLRFAKFRSRAYLPIMSTRGCPFKCAFCSEPLTNPRVRFRSPGNVVDEMQKWQSELGLSHFCFVDSNITLNRGQVEGICNEIISRNLNITWEGWTRANLVDEEILRLMKRAGLIRISYGIESGDPRILKIIRKDVSIEDVLKAFRITEDLGIEPACSVMIGLPGETRKSAERTIDFVKDIPQVLYSNLSIANPYPGTEMHRWALEGRHGLKLLTDSYSDYQRYDRSPISVNDLSRDDLVRLQKTGLLRIHFTPRRIRASIKMIGFWNILPLFLNFIAAGFKQFFKAKKK